NRIRFLIEIIDAVSKVLTTQSLWLRISATDWADGGWTCYDSVKLIQVVKAMGVEVVDVSTGGAVHHQQIPVSDNYQIPFAERIRKDTGILTGAVGLIKSAQQAEDILQNNQADLVLIGRAFLQNPHLVYQFAHELNENVAWAPQYERGKETF